MRVSLPVRAILALAVALPLGAYAARPGYREVRWPKADGLAAPTYRTGHVSAVATDRQGRVFVFHRSRRPVLVFDRSGRFLTSWGQNREDLFYTPHGCRIDPEGNVWLTDVDTHQVMKFTPDGTLLMSLGVSWRDGDDPAHFNGPADVAFGRNGDFYVADGYGNARVVRFSKDGQYLGEWGGHGDGRGEFQLPHSIECDAEGNVYVADRENYRIQVFTPEGQFLRMWETEERPFGLFLTPDQKLYVANGTDNSISIFRLDGRHVRTFKTGGVNVAHLLCVDDRNAIYLADLYGKRAHKYVRR